VKQVELEGIGGKCKGFIHSFRLGLIDPMRPPHPIKNPPIWEATISEMIFVSDLKVGLVGMDVISEWKEFRIVPKKDGGDIHIMT
jgi:hypothetical protein